LIRIDACLFRAADLCRSFEETRYYLNGVYVQPHPEKGILLTATDGHRLICIYDENGECSEAKIVNIDAKAIDQKALDSYRKEIAADKPKESPKVEITIDEAGIVSVGTYRSIRPCFVDGTYPDYRAVLKPVLAGAREQKYTPANFNNRYLADFGKIGAVLSPDGNKSVALRVVSFGDGNPALVRFGTMDHVFAILMPTRAGASNEFPIWMKPILEPAPVPAAPAAAIPEPEPTPRPKPKARAKAKKRPVARRAVVKRKAARPVKKPAKRRAA
jgi:hypothetical protein